MSLGGVKETGRTGTCIIIEEIGDAGGGGGIPGNRNPLATCLQSYREPLEFNLKPSIAVTKRSWLH